MEKVIEDKISHLDTLQLLALDKLKEELEGFIASMKARKVQPLHKSTAKSS